MEVYVLLTRTDTAFSKLIHALSGDLYTHAAIGVDGAKGPFYGFGRKYPNLPYPGAFRIEQPELFKHVVPCRVYKIEVSEESYCEISKVLHKMYECKESYHYSILGVVLCRFGVRAPRIRRRHFFCSQFVAWLLEVSGAVKLGIPYSLFRPSDFCNIVGAELVYEGLPPWLRIG